MRTDIKPELCTETIKEKLTLTRLMPLPHTATKHQASSHIHTITFSYFIYTRVLTSSIPPVVHTTLPATTCQPAYWLSVASQK